MKIYTSYFGNIEILKRNNVMPVAICCYPPTSINCHNYSLFAPSRDILDKCRGNHVLYKERFKREILDVLSKDDVYNFINDLTEKSQGNDVALCCYEKPNDFCHRHIVAEYLNENFGLDVKEFKVEKKEKTALF